MLKHADCDVSLYCFAGLLLLCWLVVAVLATVIIIIAYKKGHFEGVARVEVVFSLVQSVISARFVAFKLLRKG